MLIVIPLQQRLHELASIWRCRLRTLSVYFN